MQVTPIVAVMARVMKPKVVVVDLRSVHNEGGRKNGKINNVRRPHASSQNEIARHDHWDSKICKQQETQTAPSS